MASEADVILAEQLADQIEDLLDGHQRAVCYMALGIVIGAGASTDQEPHHDNETLDGTFASLRRTALEEMLFRNKRNGATP